MGKVRIDSTLWSAVVLQKWEKFALKSLVWEFLINQKLEEGLSGAFQMLQLHPGSLLQ